MATDVVRADLGSAVPVPQYAPSWVNALINTVERAPGPPWIVYLALTVVSVVLSNVQGWLAGVAKVGDLSLIQSGWGVFTIAIVAAVHLFDRLAQSAFDSVRPLMTVSAPDAARLRYDLTVIPARPAELIALVSVPLTVSPYVFDPAGAAVVGYPPLAIVLRAAVESFSTAVLLVLVFQTIRQLRSVSQILNRVTRLDLFHPSPLYAFSRLTGGIGAALMLVVAAGLVLAPSSTQTTSVFYASWYVAFIVFAVAVFVVPLLGMHGRLRDEKERLQVEADERLKGILAALNQDAARLELGRADGLNKTLASLLQQRDVLARLPTWPWSTGTLRGFLTAIGLPLVLFVVQRAIGQLV